MNILHVGPKNFPPSHGGVEKSVFDIVNNKKNTHTNYILTEWESKKSNNVFHLESSFFSQIKQIFSIIDSKNIDVIHLNKETFIPHSLVLVFHPKIKVIHSIRGCAWRIKRWGYVRRILFYILDILACLFLKNVVFVGLTDYQHFSKYRIFKGLHFNPNGVDKTKLISKDINNQCVYIGRISPEKNLHGLISFFEINNSNLTIFGPFDKHDLSYKNLILDRINKNKNIFYGGILKYNEIQSTLSKFNVFCNFSFSEGMPVSVLEAASVGLNLILSNIHQHTSLQFFDVIFVDPYQPNHKEFNFNGPSKMNKQIVESKYSIQSTVNFYLDLYEK